MPADRSPPKPDGSPETDRDLLLLPPLGRAGGGPVVGLGLVALLLFALSAGVTSEAQALWPFDRLFDRGPVGERIAVLLSEAIQINTSNPPGNERAPRHL